MRLFPGKRPPVKTVYAAATPTAATATPTADPRVEKDLQWREIDYTVTENGNFQVRRQFPDSGRAQTAYVASKTMTFGGWAFRKVYSTAFTVDGPLPQAQANRLMADSGRHPFGAWCLYHEKDGRTSVFYQVAVWEKTTSYSLRDAIDLVCAVAAGMDERAAGESLPPARGTEEPAEGPTERLAERLAERPDGQPGAGGLPARLFPWMRPGVDRSVRGRLRQAHLKYRITDDGDYAVPWHFPEDGRSQTARVSSRAATFNGDSWRQVSSVAFTVDGPLLGERAVALMADSDRHTFGAWCLDAQGDTTVVKFQVAVAADALYFDLENAIHLVCLVADNMEKEVVGWDSN